MAKDKFKDMWLHCVEMKVNLIVIWDIDSDSEWLSFVGIYKIY